MIYRANRNFKQRILRLESSRAFDINELEDFGEPIKAVTSSTVHDAGSTQKEIAGTEPEDEGEALLDQLDELKKQVLDDAQCQADELIENARERAIKMLEDAKRNADQLHEQATKEGYKEGLEKGMMDGMERLQTQFDHIQHLSEQLQERFSTIQKESMQTLERQAVTLSLALAKRIVGREVQTQPDAIIPLIRQCIEMLRSFQKFTIWVSREDISFLREHRNELLETFDKLESIHIRENKQLQHGECLVETDKELIDATFAERFKLAEEVMRELEEQVSE